MALIGCLLAVSASASGICLLAVSASASEILYGADGAQGNPSKLYVLSPSTGAAVSTVGPIGFAVTGLAVHPITGVLYGSTSRASATSPASLITVNKATGVGALVGPFGVPSATMGDLTFTSDGTLFGLNTANGNLYRVSLSTGQATTAASTGLGPPSGAALAANACDVLFAAALGAHGPLSTLSLTGGNTAVATLNGPATQAFSAMAFSLAGTLYASLLDNSGSVPAPASLVTINTSTGAVTVLGPTVNQLDAIAFDSGAVQAGRAPLAAAILPASRSPQVGHAATAFATIINAGTSLASGVGISPQTSVLATFSYQTTAASTNAVIGAPNTPVCIAPGSQQSFVIALTPTAVFDPTDVAFTFGGSNTVPVAPITGVNTLLVSGSAMPVPDVVALGATLNNDGIVNIPAANGTGIFAVATVNVGASGLITASADTGGATLPVGISLCQTNPASSACLATPAGSVTTQIDASSTPTFAVFVQGGAGVPFDPANNRIFVRFRDAGGIIRGATSVAVRTQ